MRLNSNLRKRIANLAAKSVQKDFRAQASEVVRTAQLKALTPASRQLFEAAAPLIRMEQHSHWAMNFTLDIWPLHVRPTKFKSDRDWWNFILKGLHAKKEANDALVAKVRAAADAACYKFSTTEKLLAAHPELKPFYDKVIENSNSMVSTAVAVQTIETGGDSLKALLKKGTNARKPIPATTAAK